MTLLNFYITQNLLFLTNIKTLKNLETILNLPTTPLHWALLTSLFVALGIQFFYYNFYTQFIKNQKKNKKSQTEEPISIIICAKNEGIYLQKNLINFLEQEYSEFELVIVNDGSLDDTETIIAQHQQNFPNLRTTKIPLDEKFHHNKKLAITIGIKAAKFERLVFSDIRNKPSSKKWLSELSKTWINSVQIAYSNFENKKGLAYNFRKFDLLFKNITSMSFAAVGKAHSGNGNNLAYKKSDFLKNKGFAKQSHFESGYDHLMAHQLAKKNGASVCIDPNSKIILPKEDSRYRWKIINEQYYKSRKHLPRGLKLLIDFEPLSKMLFYFLFTYSLFFTDLYILLGFAFIIRLIIIGRCFKIITTHLKEENLFLSSYLYDFFVPFSRMYFLCANFIFSKRNQWK